jgi:hypothetical protein
VLVDSSACHRDAFTAVLEGIYRGRRLLYLTSKYGGMLSSVAMLLLYNRYVTDVLTGIKAFDAALLRSLALASDGLDLETEIVAKLSLRREYMLELPVDWLTIHLGPAPKARRSLPTMAGRRPGPWFAIGSPDETVYACTIHRDSGIQRRGLHRPVARADPPGPHRAAGIYSGDHCG